MAVAMSDGRDLCLSPCLSVSRVRLCVCVCPCVIWARVVLCVNIDWDRKGQICCDLITQIYQSFHKRGGGQRSEPDRARHSLESMCWLLWFPAARKNNSSAPKKRISVLAWRCWYGNAMDGHQLSLCRRAVPGAARCFSAEGKSLPLAEQAKQAVLADPAGAHRRISSGGSSRASDRH